MKNEVRNQTKKEYVLPVSILVAAMVLSSVWIYTTGLKIENQENSGVSVASEQTHVAGLEEKILPTDGVVLPVVWGDLGAKLVSVGAIDAEKFKAIYERDGQSCIRRSRQFRLNRRLDDCKREPNGSLQPTSVL